MRIKFKIMPRISARVPEHGSVDLAKQWLIAHGITEPKALYKAKRRKRLARKRK